MFQMPLGCPPLERPAQPRGEPLDRSVGDELDRAVSQPVVAAIPVRAHALDADFGIDALAEECGHHANRKVATLRCANQRSGGLVRQVVGDVGRRRDAAACASRRNSTRPLRSGPARTDRRSRGTPETSRPFRPARRSDCPRSSRMTPSTSRSRVMPARASIALLAFSTWKIRMDHRDRPLIRNPVEIARHHAPAAIEDRVSMPRCDAAVRRIGHRRLGRTQRADHLVDRRQAAPLRAIGPAARVADIGPLPHAAFEQMAVRLDQPRHQHAVGIAIVDAMLAPPRERFRCRRPGCGRRARRLRRIGLLHPSSGCGGGIEREGGGLRIIMHYATHRTA